jgi:hypothetical protein
LAGDGDRTIADEMDEVAVKGLHRIEVRDSNGDPDEAVLEIRYRKLRVLPPIGKQNRYPALALTVIYAEERGTPKNRKKIDWKLITDVPVGSRTDAIEKLEWYALRWKIEVFHKILKSGCKAEESKLRTAQRLTNLISILCILSWRVFWMTMLNRSAPHAPPTLALTATEIGVLDRVVNDKPKARQKTLSRYLIKIARLGGYLARASDPPPGNTVMWRGLSRLTDIALGAMEENLWVIESLTGGIRTNCTQGHSSGLFGRSLMTKPLSLMSLRSASCICLCSGNRPSSPSTNKRPRIAIACCSPLASLCAEISIALVNFSSAFVRRRSLAYTSPKTKSGEARSLWVG